MRNALALAFILAGCTSAAPAGDPSDFSCVVPIPVPWPPRPRPDLAEVADMTAPADLATPPPADFAGVCMPLGTPCAGGGTCCPAPTRPIYGYPLAGTTGQLCQAPPVHGDPICCDWVRVYDCDSPFPGMAQHSQPCVNCGGGWTCGACQ